MTVDLYSTAINFSLNTLSLWLTTCKVLKQQERHLPYVQFFYSYKIIYTPICYSFNLKYFQQQCNGCGFIHISQISLERCSPMHESEGRTHLAKGQERLATPPREGKVKQDIYMGSSDGSAHPKSPLYGSGFHPRPIGRRVPEILPAQTRQTS